MAPPSTIRKALGAVKDQTSIGLAKVSSNVAPDIDVAVVKATSHADEPAEERHIREILNLTGGAGYSRHCVSACVAAVSKRLGGTRDWVVALKALMLVHRLMADGDPAFRYEILHATRRGTRLLNMSDFRDEAHSRSWDHSAFVRTYALYLDQRLECALYEHKQQHGGGSNDRPYHHRRGNSADHQGGEYYDHDRHRDDIGYGGGGGGGSGGRHSYSSSPAPPGNVGPGGEYVFDDRRGAQNQNGGDGSEQRKPVTPVREMKPERVLGRMHQLQQLLDRFLACRPTGTAKNSRMVLIALYPAVRESFQLYADICEILAVLLDGFFDMEYQECVKAFEAYASAAKQIDELAAFYGWCKDVGVARTSEIPEVQRITDKLLETLEEFMRDRARRPKSPERPPREEVVVSNGAVQEEEEPVEDMNSIKALPAPEGYEEQKAAAEKQQQKQQQQQEETADLVNLRDEGVSAAAEADRLALALFSPGTAAGGNIGSWEAFPSSAESEVTSAWQTPAAEKGKADWELALVETASNLSKQKATLAGGFDPLLLNGMYDAGTVRQHVNSAQMSGGSGSSVALPGLGQRTTPVLALPAPDGTVQTVGQDPFAASLSVPPPPYVQMADMEKKQQLLVQEQHLWQTYARDGMQGQVSLAKLSNGYGHAIPPMPYGMPQPSNGGHVLHD